MSLTLTQLGGLALFEDLGRSGYADLGVSPSGAANRSALARANLALGNAAGAPALEVIGTCRLLAHRSAILALAGAPAAVTGGEQQRSADGTLVIAVAAGEEISLRPRGIRTYIAVRGGFEVPRVLGSASHDTLSGLGPPPLQEGDALAIGTERRPLRTINPDRASSPLTGAPAALLVASVYPGPRANWVDNLDALFDNEYRVSDLADRIGVRLRGPRIVRTRQEELPSEGIVRGAIQIPPSGEPLIFGPDHPTTGGYPVVGVLAPAAVDALAHAAPGQVIRFRRARLRTG